eukprot:4266487-Lingulodinium_polyedra.AAC.1
MRATRPQQRVPGAAETPKCPPNALYQLSWKRRACVQCAKPAPCRHETQTVQKGVTALGDRAEALLCREQGK